MGHLETRKHSPFLWVGDCSILFGNQLLIPQLYQAPGTQSTTLSYVKGWRSEHPFPAGKSGCHSFTAPHLGTVLPVPQHPDEGSCQPLANSSRPEGCRQLVRNVNKLEIRNAGRERKSGCGSLIVCARVHIHPESSSCIFLWSQELITWAQSFVLTGHDRSVRNTPGLQAGHLDLSGSLRRV